MKNLKRFSLIICIVIICSAVLSLASCSSPPPELDDVRERIKYLLENSQEVNQLFWGEGLDVYSMDDPEFEEMYSDVDTATFEYVTPDSKYQSIDDIKNAAAKVYSSEYLEKVYEAAFLGTTVEVGDTVVVGTARYYDDENGLMQSVYVRRGDDSYVLIHAKRIFDISTLKYETPSSGSYLNVSVDSWLEGDENNVVNITLQFSLAPDGNWYLDSPSY